MERQALVQVPPVRVPQIEMLGESSAVVSFDGVHDESCVRLWLESRHRRGGGREKGGEGWRAEEEAGASREARRVAQAWVFRSWRCGKR